MVQIQGVYEKILQLTQSGETISTAMIRLNEAAETIKNEAGTQSEGSTLLQETMTDLLESSHQVNHGISRITSENESLVELIRDIREMSDESTRSVRKLTSLLERS